MRINNYLFFCSFSSFYRCFCSCWDWRCYLCGECRDHDDHCLLESHDCHDIRPYLDLC